MRTPQDTEQYGQILRVSVARASLKVRTSAWAAVGEKPIATMDDPVSPAEQTLKNCRLFMFIVSFLLMRLRVAVKVRCKEQASFRKSLNDGESFFSGHLSGGTFCPIDRLYGQNVS